jgi:hypothetical protein
MPTSSGVASMTSGLIVVVTAHPPLRSGEQSLLDAAIDGIKKVLRDYTTSL